MNLSEREKMLFTKKIMKLSPLIIFLLILPLNLPEFVESYNTPIQILVIVDDGYGGNVPPIIDHFKSFGWNVTIAGLSETVTSCPYLGLATMETDILIPNIMDVTIYDAVSVLPGDSHVHLIANQTALNLIKTAAEANVVVSGWCRAVRVLAFADVLDGRNVTGHASYVADYEAAGATFVSDDTPPVIDGNIVTSVRSNHYQLHTCNAIGKAIGVFESNVPIFNDFDVTFNPTNPNQFSISFEVIDESTLLYMKIWAFEVNRTTRERLSIYSSYYNSLTDQQSGEFNITVNLEAGLYEVDIEIVDEYYNIFSLKNCTLVDIPEEVETEETEWAVFFVTMFPIIGLTIILSRKRK
ncbi:MAG: DJ-1/PfpI family protein [Candidatus Heimdallarchaeaceae archaeon]